jgi:RNA polymerase sigma factor (sigma-70 family)
MIAYTSFNEKNCWEYLKQGSPEALGYLYDKHIDTLFTAALRVTGDREAAKDALQEVFIEIWNYRKTLGEVRHSQSYLIKVLRNILFKKMRANTSFLEILNQESVHSPDQNIEELIISADTDTERRKQLHHAVSMLTKRQKQILELRFNQGLTYDQIAARLDMNYQSVNNLAFRTLRRLRVSMPPMLLFVFAIC